MTFAVTKLNAESSDFINYLIANNKASCPITELAIAWAIAKKLPLPTGRVDNVDDEFRFTKKLVVFSLLSKLNEFVILNQDNLYELIRKLYGMRYTIVYPPELIWSPGTDTILPDFLSISMALDANTLKVIQSDPQLLCKTHNSAVKFFNQYNN